MLWNDYHGTRCAGQIAASKNDACGVGIAYEAKVSGKKGLLMVYHCKKTPFSSCFCFVIFIGIRILSGEITDVDEAAALNYKYQENDIFSCSWGPTDE